MEKKKRFVDRLPLIFLGVALVAVLAAAGWLLSQLIRDLKSPAPEPPVNLDEQPEAEAPDSPAPGTDPYEPDMPEKPDTPAPADPQAHTFGSLTLHYDEAAVTADGDDGKTRVTLRTTEDATPRLDAQKLTRTQMSDAQAQAAAIGILQAYYADPPATDTLTAAADAAVSGGYTLTAPATGDTPAMAARVRFLTDGSATWFLILVWPDGETPDSTLTAVYEGAQLGG